MKKNLRISAVSILLAGVWFLFSGVAEVKAATYGVNLISSENISSFEHFGVTSSPWQAAHNAGPGSWTDILDYATSTAYHGNYSLYFPATSSNIYAIISPRIRNIQTDYDYTLSYYARGFSGSVNKSSVVIEVASSTCSSGNSALYNFATNEWNCVSTDILFSSSSVYRGVFEIPNDGSFHRTSITFITPSEFPVDENEIGLFFIGGGIDSTEDNLFLIDGIKLEEGTEATDFNLGACYWAASISEDMSDLENWDDGFGNSCTPGPLRELHFTDSVTSTNAVNTSNLQIGKIVLEGDYTGTVTLGWGGVDANVTSTNGLLINGGTVNLEGGNLYLGKELRARGGVINTSLGTNVVFYGESNGLYYASKGAGSVSKLSLIHI